MAASIEILPAAVVDVGSLSVRAGLAGEEAPSAIFPSFVGHAPPLHDPTAAAAAAAADGSSHEPQSKKLKIGSSALGAAGQNHLEIQPVLKDGIVGDWAALEAILDFALRDSLSINPSEFGLLLAERSFNPPAEREKTVQLLFEKYGCPAVYLSKDVALAAFSSGRKSAVVVDCGAVSTTVAVVSEGKVLPESISRLPIGGDLLSLCLQNALEAKGAVIASDDSPNATDSSRIFAKRAIVNSIKESLCHVPEQPFQEANYAEAPLVSYSLSNGQKIEVGVERFRVPELLFNPSVAKFLPGMDGWLQEHPIELLKSIPQLIVESVAKCGANAPKNIFGSVVLSGGSSALPNFRERLERELTKEAPQGARVRVVASSNPTTSAWVGGSILATLPAFQSMWFTKAEFEEHGAQYVHKKCPY